MRHTGLSIAAAGLAALSVASCSKPKTRPAPSPEDLPPALVQRQADQAAGSALGRTTPAPLPDRPAWAGTFMGRPLKSVFPDGGGQCIGYTDKVDWRYQGAPPGVMVEGWGWDVAAKAPVTRILLTDPSGQVVGAGEGGVTPRPDVPTVRKEVTSGVTGWKATSPLTEGVLLAYGVTGNGTSTCPLGQIKL